MNPKALYIICAILATSAVAESQLVRAYGFKVGACMATQEWQETSDVTLPIEFRWGVDAALFVEGLNLPPLSVLAEVHYIQKGYNLRLQTWDVVSDRGPFNSFDTRLDYVSLPIFVKAQLRGETLSPYVFAGPRIDLLVGSFQDGPTSGLPFERFEMGGSIGIGTEVSLSSLPTTFAEIRYSPNFTPAFEADFLTTTNSSLEFLVGIQI